MKTPRHAEKLVTKTQLDRGTPASQPGGIDRLPVELLDFVLACVWEDKPTILACSRVSRLWHDVARPHFFASLKIARWYSFDDLRDILHTNVDIARYVRKLHLTRRRSPEHRDIFPLVDRIILRDLVAALPRLRELQLYNVWVVSPPNPTPGTPEHPPTHRLEKLTIEHCRAPAGGHPSLVTLLNLVSLFALVDVLEFSWTHIPGFDWTHVLDISLDPTHLIQTLDVGTLVTRVITLAPELESNTLYSTLHAALAPGCLRSLQLELIRGVGEREPAVLQSFGQLVGDAARNALHIDLPFSVSSPVGTGEDAPEHWRVLNLHACTSLTSLSLSLDVPPTRAPAGSGHIPRVPLAHVCIALLAHVPATLRVLTIKLWNVSAQAQIKSAKKLGLRELDAALAERFGNLERVDMMLGVGYRADKLECSLAVLKSMPRLRTKGVLAVVDWVSH